jgi:hypothetical protein
MRHPGRLGKVSKSPIFIGRTNEERRICEEGPELETVSSKKNAQLP